MLSFSRKELNEVKRESNNKEPMILVLGGPRTGKSTFSKTLSDSVWCSDDVMGRSWAEQPEIIARTILERKYEVVEGVAVARGVRNLLRRGFKGKDICSELYVLTIPKVYLSSGQLNMKKGTETIIKEIIPYLDKYIPIHYNVY